MGHVLPETLFTHGNKCSVFNPSSKKKIERADEFQCVKSP